MASETVNRYRKARKIARVFTHLVQIDDVSVLQDSQVRKDALVLAGYRDASFATWELVTELVREHLDAKVSS